MRYFALILALGLGLTSAAHAAEEVPTANQCSRSTYNQYGRTIHNDCSEAIEVVLHFSDGNSTSHAFGQNALDGQTINDRKPAASNQTLTTYIAGSITKPSPGQSIYGVKSWQTNGTGWGTSAEYRMQIQGRNYGGILFSNTPTNSSLYLPRQEPFISWPIRRYEFDVLWTHEFAPVRHRLVPYVTSGVGAIALNGGSTRIHSGWDRQAALVGGAGGDVRLSRLITLRAGFTMDSFKASTYSDPSYHSTGTIMVEPRIGLVWGFGLPHPR